VYQRIDRPTSVLGVADEVDGRMNDLELYLAGFLPADSVTTPLTRDGYTLADVIRVIGDRDRGLSQTRRQFTIGFIVVGAAPLADAELAFFHHVAAEYVATESPLGLTWHQATGRRSTLDGVLPRPQAPPSALRRNGL
jgi:hypothetical protein